jgi:hypothetical protein
MSRQARPSLFIGSSSEGYDVARAAEVVLKEYADVTLWKNGVFGLNLGTLESLVAAADKFDFAVLVLTPDDMTLSRGEVENSPRDNVLFEAGLFMGRLGRQRAFILHPKGKGMKIPSDLAGVSVATFELPADGNIRSAVSSACYDIIDAVKSLGKVGRVVPMTNPSLAATLNEMVRNTSAALKIDHPEFRGEVASHCREWNAVSRDWAQGKIVVRQNYEALLANVYRSAKEAIFSTSIPEYQKTWQSAMGKALLQIQKQNGAARSTRIFIFNKSEDVTDDDVLVFDEHARCGIEVFVYIDEEDPTFLFPVDVGTD